MYNHSKQGEFLCQVEISREYRLYVSLKCELWFYKRMSLGSTQWRLQWNQYEAPECAYVSRSICSFMIVIIGEDAVRVSLIWKY